MRKWLILLIPFLILLIFLPDIASTRLGKPLFVRALAAKTQAQIEIGSLKLSWFGPQYFKEIRWSRDQVNGTVDELQINAPFWTFSGPFQLKNGSVTYKSGSIQQIEGQIVDHDFALTGITLQGHISVKGQVYSKLHFNLAIDITNFPLIVLDQQLDRILGPTLNLSGTLSMVETQGTIDLTLSSANLNTELHGNLSPHAITLRHPLTATLRLTPELSALLLKDANPLFFTGLESKNPITLTLQPENTSLPFPFSLERLKATGTLDLGQVRCQNGKTLATIIALLKATRLADAQQMNGWFTPIDFKIEKGFITTERMDVLLADSIHVCTWGSIDLLTDRLHMILGLPADTLENSFGIRNLPENYVMKVDVRGTTKEPDIVKGPAAAKIAALIAAGQIPKKSVFSGLADLFSRPKEESDVPPAKRPFPWER